MRRLSIGSFLPLGALLAPLALGAQTTVAFTGVTVIPMSEQPRLERQTVLVRDGRIVTVGPAGSVTVPVGATRIDGRGKYLIPGLHDMHAHLQSDFGYVPTSLGPDELTIMLANGITTARIMIGTPEHLDMRARVNAGTLLGPRLIVGSPQLAGRNFTEHFNGLVVDSPEAARRAVQTAAAAKYDFIKVTFIITSPVYEAIIDEAKRAGMMVVGHVDPRVGLARALEAGQQIEHLDGYFEALLPDSIRPPRLSVSGPQVWQPANWRTVALLDSSAIARIAHLTAHAQGIARFSTPTLTFMRAAFGDGQTDAEIRARPDWAFFPEKARQEFEVPRKRFWDNPPSSELRARYVSLRNVITRALADSGARIMAGSDAPDWYLNYGWTLHRELAALVDAGLTARQALEAATRTPADWIAIVRSDSTPGAGVIAPGRPADLVLLDADPLADIRNTSRIAGVMSRGRWLPRQELDRMLAQIRDRIAGR